MTDESKRMSFSQMCAALPVDFSWGDSLTPDVFQHIEAAILQAATRAQTDEPSYCDAIDGAIAFGFQGNNTPPDGHWLERFWKIGNDAAVQIDGLKGEISGLKAQLANAVENVSDLEQATTRDEPDFDAAEATVILEDDQILAIEKMVADQIFKEGTQSRKNLTLRTVRTCINVASKPVATRDEPSALTTEVLETLDMFMSLYRAKGWEGDAAYERAEALIAARTPKESK